MSSTFSSESAVSIKLSSDNLAQCKGTDFQLQGLIDVMVEYSYIYTYCKRRYIRWCSSNDIVQNFRDVKWYHCIRSMINGFIKCLKARQWSSEMALFIVFNGTYHLRIAQLVDVLAQNALLDLKLLHLNRGTGEPAFLP